MRTLFSIVVLSLALVSQSQVINSYDISKSQMHKTSIDPQNEFVSGYEKINALINISNYYPPKDMVDFEGNSMFIDNGGDRRYIIKMSDHEPIIFTPPGLFWNLPHSGACITNDGKKAVYSSGNNTVSVLDIDSRQFVYQHTFESENNLKIEWIRINDDASLIFVSIYMNDRYYPYIFKLKGEKYDIYEGGIYQKTNFPFISSLDERVYFIPQASDHIYKAQQFGYIDQNVDNYQTFVDTPLPAMNGDNVEVIDIVEQGKVFILSVGQNTAGVKQTIRYYSVSMIDDTNFEEPSLIGEIVLDPYYDSMSRWPAKTKELISYASEDGKVLVAQVLKRVEMDQDYYYDAYAFLKNPAGKWIKKKINPSNEDIKDRMLLSGNGRSLFWNRWPLAAVKNGFFK